MGCKAQTTVFATPQTARIGRGRRRGQRVQRILHFNQTVVRAWALIVLVIAFVQTIPREEA
jgi:hypothetical protein